MDYKIQEARVQIDNGLKTANEWNRRSSSEASFASRPVCASVFRDTQDSLHLFFSNQTNNPTGVFCFGAKERQQMVKRANEFEYNFFSSSQRAMISRFWVVDTESNMGFMGVKLKLKVSRRRIQHNWVDLGRNEKVSYIESN